MEGRVQWTQFSTIGTKKRWWPQKLTPRGREEIEGKNKGGEKKKIIQGIDSSL